MVSRRQFIGTSGVGLLSFVVAGCGRRSMTPAEARDAGLDYQILTTAEAATLDAVGERFVTGARDAGLSHFIDQQLTAPPGEQMLMLRYVGGVAPYVDFYRGGLDALNGVLAARDLPVFHELDADVARALATEIAGGNVDGWAGPPPGFWYFVVRSDAIDVVYGTRAGFERLGVPYMAHIEPPEPKGWGG